MLELLLAMELELIKTRTRNRRKGKDVVKMPHTSNSDNDGLLTLRRAGKIRADGRPTVNERPAKRKMDK